MNITIDYTKTSAKSILISFLIGILTAIMIASVQLFELRTGIFMIGVLLAPIIGGLIAILQKYHTILSHTDKVQVDQIW